MPFLADLPPLTDCTPRSRTDYDSPRVLTERGIANEATRRLRYMSGEQMLDEVLWLFDKQDADNRMELLHELLRVCVMEFMHPESARIPSRVMAAIKPVYEALYAEQCREIEGEQS